MKKIYTLFSLIALSTVSFAQNGQIQNGGFENWSMQTIYDYPTQWLSSNTSNYSGIPTVIKSTDASAGNFSAELRSEEIGSSPDTVFGFVAHGQMGAGDEGPTGGIPYTQLFNTVKFKYKSFLPQNDDSLYLIVIRFVGGNPIEMLAEKAAGGTHNTWTNATVTITSTPQEELFIGFVIGNPFIEDYCTPGSWARIDEVQMFMNSTATANLPDPGFENWSSMTTEIPDNWYTMNPMLASINMENVNKSTNSNSGTYAAEISTVQYPPVTGDTIRGFLSLGPINVNNWGNPFTPVPYNATPTMFSGSYDYSPSNMDQGSIQIIFYEMGVVIGQAGQQLTGTMGYNNFNFPLTITGTPDSVAILAFSGNHPGSVLLVDNFSLSGGNVGLDEFAQTNVSVYPNPAKDYVMIKFDDVYAYEIIDLTGKVLASAKDLSGAQSIDISTLKDGAYFIRLRNDKSTILESLIIE